VRRPPLLAAGDKVQTGDDLLLVASGWWWRGARHGRDRRGGRAHANDRGEAWDGSAAWMAMGCGAVGGKGVACAGDKRAMGERGDAAVDAQ
jgi:hypothetical protein